jgi:hypothetical protein
VTDIPSADVVAPHDEDIRLIGWSVLGKSWRSDDDQKHRDSESLPELDESVLNH